MELNSETKIWIQSDQILKEQAKLMDAIHEQYPGKENSKKREELLRPHRKYCTDIYYQRMGLAGSGLVDLSQVG